MTKKANKKAPPLRFPEFDGDWTVSKLEEIASSISAGATPLRSNNSYFENANIPWVKTTDLNNSEIITTEESISEIAIKETSTKKNPVNSILIAMYGGFNQIGRTGLLKIEAATNQAISVVVPKSTMSSYFLLHFLNRNVNQWRTYAASSRKDPNITGKDIAGFPIVFPKEEEQEKIASFLGAVDTRLTQLRRKRELLQIYKRGVTQKLFSQEIRFKDEIGSPFPDWEEKNLGELTFKVGRKNKQNIPYPIYSINNQKGFVPQSEQFEGVDSNDRGYDISLYKIIQKNTFAYNPARINVGSIGYSAGLENIIISSLYVCFKAKTELYDFYLLQYLETFDFNKSVLRNVEGGVREYLFYENFSNIKIPLPLLEEQQKIVDFLTTIDRKIEAISRQIDGCDRFKQGLLQKMFV